jgi:hypothetical protein
MQVSIASHMRPPSSWVLLTSCRCASISELMCCCLSRETHYDTRLAGGRGTRAKLAPVNVHMVDTHMTPDMLALIITCQGRNPLIMLGASPSNPWLTILILRSPLLLDHDVLRRPPTRFPPWFRWCSRPDVLDHLQPFQSSSEIRTGTVGNEPVRNRLQPDLGMSKCLP